MLRVNAVMSTACISTMLNETRCVNCFTYTIILVVGEGSSLRVGNVLSSVSWVNYVIKHSQERKHCLLSTISQKMPLKSEEKHTVNLV